VTTTMTQENAHGTTVLVIHLATKPVSTLMVFAITLYPTWKVSGH